MSGANTAALFMGKQKVPIIVTMVDCIMKLDP